MEPVTLTVSKQEAEAIQLLLDCGVFGIKGGSAEIHFDMQGGISAVKANVNLLRVRPVVVVLEKQSGYPHKQTLIPNDPTA
jgi:hypothetical protein